MDNVTMLQRAVDETTRLVDGLEPAQLSNTTPCTEWTVRDLLNHLTGGASMFATSAEQGSVPDDLIGQFMGGDNLGDDYAGSWKKASARAMNAFRQPGVLEKMVKLPFGEMPAGIALDIAVFDVTTHAADLARATGQAVQDNELLEAAIEMGGQVLAPEFRQPGIFEQEQSVPDSAPAADRLLAFAGRKI
jgi:uncharacterized protein (TIGR03086 family)